MHFVEHFVVASQRALADWGGYWQLVVVGLWLAFWARGRAAAQAGRIDATRRAVCSEPHEYGPVRVSDFPWLDPGYYSEMESRLAAMGFRNLGDVENLSLSAAFPWMRTATRELATSDGILTAGIWQVKVRGWRRLLALAGMVKGDVRVVEVATEFSDGTFVATANNCGLDFSRDVPGIDRVRFSNETPIEEVVASHRQRVAEYLLAYPAAQPVRVKTAREIRQSVTRADDLKCAEMARHRAVDLQRFADSAMGLRLDPQLRETAQEPGRLQQGLN